MTMWDFFHAHADGLGALVFLLAVLIFLWFFVKEMNK